MNLKPLGANKTELHLDNGAVIFFSYKTPVAAQKSEGGFIRTNEHYSRTTSKHITQWLDGANATGVDQDILDNLVSTGH